MVLGVCVLLLLRRINFELPSKYELCFVCCSLLQFAARLQKSINCLERSLAHWKVILCTFQPQGYSVDMAWTYLQILRINLIIGWEDEANILYLLYLLKPNICVQTFGQNIRHCSASLGSEWRHIGNAVVVDYVLQLKLCCEPMLWS